MSESNSKQTYRPDYLYKYLHPDRIDVLENKIIRYSQLDDMNDPFDSNPYFHSEHIRLAGDIAADNGTVWNGTGNDEGEVYAFTSSSTYTFSENGSNFNGTLIQKKDLGDIKIDFTLDLK